MRKNYISGTPAERFWPKVDRRGPDECWPWLANRLKHGYGTFWDGITNTTAHRVAWGLTHGEKIPADMDVRHSCDNPPCVNPAHLSLGTRKDNMQDMVARGRSVSHDRHHSVVHPEGMPRGEQHKRSKLTTAQVLEIRRLAAEGRLSFCAIARLFSVSDGTIHRTVKRRNWTHV